MDKGATVGTLTVFNQVFPDIKPPSVNQKLAALITKCLFPALAGDITGINIF
jgi:hypothetical protein